MGYYLLERPVAGPPKWYPQRTGRVLAIVVHITAGLEDLDGVDDHSAEKTADYCATTDRQVSWHSGSDADTAFDLLPASYTAFQCQGYNSVTYGHEISKASPDWRHSNGLWVAQTLGQAGRHLGAKAAMLGVPIRHATKAELDAAVASNGNPVGFIGHHELDPTRRSDPGQVGGVDTFPWDRFLNICRNAAGGSTPTSEDDDMTDAEKMQLVDAIASEVIKRLSEDTPTNKASDRLKKAAHAAHHLHEHFELTD